MSRALKCNRCGQCFDAHSARGYLIKFENPKVWEPNADRYKAISIRFDSELDPDEFLDLCPQCSAAFAMFMNNTVITQMIRKNDTADNGKDGV